MLNLLIVPSSAVGVNPSASNLPHSANNIMICHCIISTDRPFAVTEATAESLFGGFLC